MHHGCKDAVSSLAAKVTLVLYDMESQYSCFPFTEVQEQPAKVTRYRKLFICFPCHPLLPLCCCSQTHRGWSKIPPEGFNSLTTIVRIFRLQKETPRQPSYVFYMLKKNNCSDRILTCRIKSIRSPAKVGLVVTDLITSPVVRWRGWETPPPPPGPRLSCHSLLNHG